MSDNPSANITLKLALDQASIQQGNQGVNSLKNNFNELNSVTQNAGKVSDKAAASIGTSMSSATAEVTTATRAVNELNNSLQTTAQNATKAGSATATSASTITGNQIRRLGGEISGLGGPGQSISQIGDLVALTDKIDLVADTFKTLPGILGAAATEGGVLAGSIGAVTAVVAPLAITLGVIALAYKNFNDVIDAGAKSLTQAQTVVDAYYKAIATGTSDTLKTQLTNAQNTKKLIDDQISQEQAAVENSFKDASSHFGDLGARVLTGLAQTKPEMQAFLSNLNDLKAQSAKLGGEIQGLTTAQTSESVATNDATAAEKKLQDARDASADKAIAIAKQTAQLEASGTTKGIDDQLAQNKADQAAIREQLANTNLSIPKVHELTDRLFDLQDQAKTLTNVVRPLVSAQEEYTKALKDQKAVQDKQIATIEKYNTDVTAAEDQGAQAKLDINRRYADKVIQITQTLVDAQTAAYNSLLQKQADDQTNFDNTADKSVRASNEQLYNDQIKYQRAERDATITHLQQLQQIKDDENFKEKADLLNRNFLGLLLDRKQLTKDTGKENTSYDDAEAKRKQALQDEQYDQARQFDFEKNERIIAFQQQNKAAEVQYHRELELQNKKYAESFRQAGEALTNELNQSTSATNKKLGVLRDAAIKELTLVGQTETAKQAIFAKEYQQIQQLLGVAEGKNNQTIGGNTVFDAMGHLVQRASGGPLSAGQPSWVNDKNSSQRESFKGSMFPPGLGLFIPTQSGNVDAGANNSSTVYMTNHITLNTNNPDVMEKRLLQVLEKVGA